MNQQDQFGAVVTSGDAAAVRQFDVAVSKLMIFKPKLDHAGQESYEQRGG